MLALTVPPGSPVHAAAIVLDGKRLFLLDGSQAVPIGPRLLGRIERGHEQGFRRQQIQLADDAGLGWPEAIEFAIDALEPPLEVRCGELLLAKESQAFLDIRFEPIRLTVGEVSFRDLLFLRRGRWQTKEGSLPRPVVIGSRRFFNEPPPLPYVAPLGARSRPAGLAA